MSAGWNCARVRLVRLIVRAVAVTMVTALFEKPGILVKHSWDSPCRLTLYPEKWGCSLIPKPALEESDGALLRNPSAPE